MANSYPSETYMKASVDYTAYHYASVEGDVDDSKPLSNIRNLLVSDKKLDSDKYTRS